jgi:hypothetical protein
MGPAARKQNSFTVDSAEWPVQERAVLSEDSAATCSNCLVQCRALLPQWVAKCALDLALQGHLVDFDEGVRVPGGIAVVWPGYCGDSGGG